MHFFEQNWNNTKGTSINEQLIQIILFTIQA